jgi:hypothetical protein
MLAWFDDICAEVGQIIEITATARNGQDADGRDDAPNAQFTLGVYDSDNTKYLAKSMTFGSEKPKNLTLITKVLVTEASSSIAVCLNNEEG